MEEQKVEFFIATKGKYFASEKLNQIREMLEDADEKKADLLNITNFRSSTSIVLYTLFLGWLGIDRFLTGKTGIGVLKIIAVIINYIISLIILGDDEFAPLYIINLGISIWFLVEIFTASKRAKEYNYSILYNLMIRN